MRRHSLCSAAALAAVALGAQLTLAQPLAAADSKCQLYAPNSKDREAFEPYNQLDITLSAKDAKTKLAALKKTTETASPEYNRTEQFGGWEPMDHKLTVRYKVKGAWVTKEITRSKDKEKCGTDLAVLYRDRIEDQAFNVKDGECRVTQGTWDSAYDKKRVSRAKKNVHNQVVNIDHMVPLKNVWESGGFKWYKSSSEKAKLKKIANDLVNPQLLAVTSSCNQSKGDGVPGGEGKENWEPRNKEYWCDYSRAWVEVKDTYELTVADGERTRLAEMLGECG
ncbi:DUF1524 domain-containing protein [Streptomyces sp. NPDC017529]|uniref:GmrSD restriction endonuclease domain-containing protein n=1 Tax=Streptomyces sp. NPDC017529 TaxID=3365000 RepID=UPI0037A6E2F6